jgi:hypothetical protein
MDYTPVYCAKSWLGPGTEDGSHASAQLLGKITHKVVLLHKKNLGMEQGNCLKSV